MSDAYKTKSSDARIREETLRNARAHLFPGRISAFEKVGLSLVIGRAEDYRFWDVDGREFLDLDLVGGLYNLGHRNPDLVKVVREVMEHSDMGQPFFPGVAQADLAARLAQSSNLQYTVFTPGGTEANDIAIRSARRHTGRRKVVSCGTGYHGAAGLAGAAGNAATANSFLSDYPGEFVNVTVNDLTELESALTHGDVAALVLEPATNASGYPDMSPGYFENARKLCDKHGTVLIMDEVVTGLGRTGHLWGFQKLEIQPDVLVIGKGLSGGLYPIGAAVLSKDVGSWLEVELFGYGASFAGSEIGCALAAAVFEKCSSRDTLNRINQTATYFLDGLKKIQSRHDKVRHIRKFGALFGLEMREGISNFELMSALFSQGVFANIAGYTESVVNLKPGLLADESFCDEALERIDRAVSGL
ncbi:MAG: aspartate aminotransferase family protein [Pseudomonadota bacterium]